MRRDIRKGTTLVAYFESSSRGTELKRPNGQLVGWYDESSNTTYTANSVYYATGNAIGDLVSQC